jgi:hypothetical protein
MSERDRDFVCDWVNCRRPVGHGVVVEQSFEMLLKLEGRVELIPKSVKLVTDHICNPKQLNSPATTERAAVLKPYRQL